MVKNWVDKKFYVHGVVSFGKGECEIISIYSVFAFLNKNIVDWIRANIN